MTAKKDLKRRIRERQAETGESYVTARRQVLADAPEPRPPGPAARPSAIVVDEMIDLVEVAAVLGFRGRILMSQVLEQRVDPRHVLERLRDLLLATTADPELEPMRAVALRGEPSRLPPILHDQKWFDEMRRFVQRALAGMGGVAEHGGLVAFAVDGIDEHTVMVIAHIGFRRRQPQPEVAYVMLSAVKSAALGSDAYYLP